MKYIINNGILKHTGLGHRSGFIPLIAVRCFDNGYVEKQPVALKEYFEEYWLKKHQESIDRCTGRRDIAEILLKTALNTIQSINQL